MRKLLRLMPLKPFRLIALVTGIFLAAFGFASATDPEPLLVPVQFDHYIHRDGGAPADPVNLVFLTSPGTDPTASVHHVLGWDVVQGSPMSFIDSGAQEPSRWQMGMDLSRSARWHLRIENKSATGSASYLLAAVHRDDTTSCGHVGTAFNAARSTVADAFASAGYPVTMIDLGNDQPGRQCDGSYTSGDGLAAVIDLRTPAR